MSKFTSGEWYIERNVHDAYSDVEHELVVPEDWCIGKDYIAAVIDLTDARLIAAAPEMYRLLKILSSIDEPVNEERFDDLLLAVDEARKVLSRIDGKEAEA